MATRADGTLPRSGKPANDAAKEAHAILVQAERGLTDSLAKPKVSNANADGRVPVGVPSRRDRPPVASTFAEFGEGAAEVRRLGDDGPGGKGVIRRLEGVAAMKQTARGTRARSWRGRRSGPRRGRELAGEAAALVAAPRESKRVRLEDRRHHGPVRAGCRAGRPRLDAGRDSDGPTEGAEEDADKDEADDREADAEADPAAVAAAAARARRARRRRGGRGSF